MDNVLSERNEWSELVRTGPGTPMGILLRKFWQPVAVSAELKNGKAKPLRIMSEDLTLYRGESGKPYIVSDRCAHRLTLLHTGWVEQDCIRCKYHGWKYDGEGQCVEMPAEDATFVSKVKILSYPVREYAGLVFAYLGTGAPPEFPRKAELDRDYGAKWSYLLIWPCNWFQRIENSLDAVHVSFVHRGGATGKAVSYGIPELSYEETEWGIRQIATRAADNVRIGEFSWPNCNHIASPMQFKPKGDKKFPWSDLFNWFVPIDDEHTGFFSARSAPVRGELGQEFHDWLSSCDSYNPADFHKELFKGVMPDIDGNTINALQNAQDYIVQVGQGPIVDRSKERLGKSDAGVILLRKIFRREVDAIKKGQPGKDWKPRVGFAKLPVPPHVPLAPDSE